MIARAYLKQMLENRDCGQEAETGSQNEPKEEEDGDKGSF
jgi:hypothetical protein